MRVAAIYDIHANLPALEAVLQDIGRAKVDHVVVGGDVLPGPMPSETISCLLHFDTPMQFIQRNGDREVLAAMSGAEIASLPEPAQEAVRWTAEQLRPEHERWLASWPKTLTVEIRGLGQVRFCHATPLSDTEIFTRLTPEDRLLPAFEEVNVPVVVCGHTHMQFDRIIGKMRVLNAGRVGMPFGKAGAYWLLLGPEIQLRHTPYDLANAAERIQATNYPQAQDFAKRNVVQPPPEEQMLKAFARVKMR
jgi:predicted phosphodiesterase